MEKSYVYKICFKSSEDFYVGGAKKYKSRVRNHLCQLRKGKHHNKNLQNMVNTFGIEDLYFVLLEESTMELVREREQYYLDLLKPKLNIGTRVDRVGIKMSKEIKEKLSKSHIGIKPTVENVKKRSETMKKKFSLMSDDEKERRT